MNATRAAVVVAALGDFFNVIGVVLGLFCLLVNLYFAVRFAQLSSFSKNLRIILVYTNLLSLGAASIHPLLVFVPEKYYKFSHNASSHTAFLFYAFQFAAKVMTIILDSKFLLIVLELRRAFHHRATYESHSGDWGLRLIGIWTVGATTIIATKTACTLITSTAEIDERLNDAFVAYRNPNDFWVFLVAALFAAIAAGVTIFTLICATSRYESDSSTLSERFQMRQMLTVLKVVRYLWSFFTLGLIIDGAVLMAAFYDYYFVHGSVDSPYYATAMHFEYFLVSVYGLVSTIYLTLRFRRMRQLFWKDVSKLFGVKRRTDSVIEPNKDEWNAHLHYLRAQGW